MFVTMLAVLALAGAPASTHVDCNLQLPANVELGLTVSDEATIVDGRVVMGTLDHIILGATACQALAYGDASLWGRFLMYDYNPNLSEVVGVGLQVALHESEHVALNSNDECLVEKAARTKIDTLIRQVGVLLPVPAEAAAAMSDAGLPSQYHGC
jgi:hypothetical protein